MEGRTAGLGVAVAALCLVGCGDGRVDVFRLAGASDGGGVDAGDAGRRTPAVYEPGGIDREPGETITLDVDLAGADGEPRWVTVGHGSHGVFVAECRDGWRATA